jgi:hypothetical protein
VKLTIGELRDGRMVTVAVMQDDLSTEGDPGVCDELARYAAFEVEHHGLSGEALFRRMERAFSNGYLMAKLEHDPDP